MEFRHIRSFLSVAETLHFGRSARLLNLSQPALSLQVKALEDELGIQLLSRNRQGTVLTEAGQAFREDAAIALERLEFAKRKAQWASAGKLGHIRIGFISTAGFEIVPNLMRRFRKSYPDVEFSIRNILRPAPQRPLRTPPQTDSNRIHGSARPMSRSGSGLGQSRPR